MSGPIEFAKKHPLMTGASVIALIGIVVLAGGSGGSGGQVQSGPTAEQVAANTTLQLASLENATRSQEIAGGLNVSLARIAQEDRAATLASQIETQRLALGAQVSLREIDSQFESSMAATEANRQIQLGAQTAAVAQANIEANAQKYAADKAYKASKKQSSASIFGSIASIGVGLLGFFSDARLKTNIRYLRTVDGVRWYRYQWNAFARERFGCNDRWSEGVLAQEVLKTKYRDCVRYDHNMGYYTVDYDMLAAMQSQRQRAIA